MELAPDLSEDLIQEKDFLIVVLYKKNRIIELEAKAESTKDLREKYVGMLTGMTLQEGITIQVYEKVGDEWHIIEKHLF